MTCLKDIEKILEGKKGYKELLEKIEQKDFSSIEGTDSGYMNKFIEREEEREYIDSEKLIDIDRDLVRLIIEGKDVLKLAIGKKDVSEYKSIEFYSNIDNIIDYFDKQEIKFFFSKFTKLRDVYLCGLELYKTDWGKDVLLEITKYSNIQSLNLGQNRLHLVDWGKNILKEFARNSNIRSLNLGRTELDKIDGGGEILKNFAGNPNIRSFGFWMTNLNNISGGDEILLKFIKNPSIKKINLGSNRLDHISGGDNILLKLLKKTNLEYLHLGTTVEILELKGYLPKEVRGLLKLEMYKEDLEKIRKALRLAENGGL